MATYKVLQDIEAEDKFVGPLTLKQFILAAITAVSLYISFFLLTKGIWVLVLPLVPVIIVSGFLAFPWGRDQPTETWLLAKLHYYFKPRKRIWDQSGMQELVKITVPKKVEEQLSDGLSQTEVKSRLKALADTIDSRGWAVKGVDGATATQLIGAASTDRLVDASILPSTSPTIDTSGVADIFDSPQANNIATQIAASGYQHRNDATQTMQQANDPGVQGPPDNFWFMNQASSSTPSNGMTAFGTQVVATQPADEPILPQSLRKAPVPDVDEGQILNEIHAKRSQAHDSFRNHRTIVPNGQTQANNQAAYPVTAAPDPATIELARNNDRNVASLARESSRLHPQQDDNEVIVSLH